eukprot:1196256-Pleurochrysis_carterae.AAC.1
MMPSGDFSQFCARKVKGASEKSKQEASETRKGGGTGMVEGGRAGKHGAHVVKKLSTTSRLNAASKHQPSTTQKVEVKSNAICDAWSSTSVCKLRRAS